MRSAAMPITLEAPSPTVRQVSGKDPNGAWILSVLAKITYVRNAENLWVLAPEQVPLVGDQANNEVGELSADTDMFPWKPKTDLVVHGHAYGRGRHQFDVNIAVDSRSVKKIRVLGDREVAALGGGNIFLGPPAAVDKIPLSYMKAYGGVDKFAQANGPDPFIELAAEAGMTPEESATVSRYRYPRNPVGCGYLIEATVEGINALTMPNFEDPLDLLTPERLAAKKPGFWYKMPLPQGTGWFHPTWFPRFGYFGLHHGTEDDPKTVKEIALGFAPENILKQRPVGGADAFGLTQGASLGLQLPHLTGGETITIDNVTPGDGRFGFKLPARPKIWVDGRKGTLKETDPVIHTVVMEPDAKRVSVVWRGAAPALRPYLPEELAKMPLKLVW
jgi:hypothetical protein